MHILSSCYKPGSLENPFQFIWTCWLTVQSYKSNRKTYRCLPGRGMGLTQDLTLILSTKNTEQKKKKKKKKKKTPNKTKQRKENPSKNPSTTKEVEIDSLWRIYAVCYCQQQHPWKCQSWRCCVLLPLNFMKSFKMKICCVLLPASLWRRYSCVLF